MNQRQRNTSLDALRVIATFAVVWLHVSAYVVVSKPDVNSMVWWTGNIANSFSNWSVPVFVMVSGALFLSSPSRLTLTEIYKKKASRLLPPIIFWTIVYVIFQSYTSGEFNLNLILKNTIAGKPYYHLWYLYMIIGMYLFAPFMQRLVVIIDASSLRILIVCCFGAAAIESLLGGFLGTHTWSTFLTRFIPFTGYFLAGYYLLNYSRNLSNLLLLLTFFASGLIIAAGTGSLLPFFGRQSWKIMYTNLNPIVIIMSLCVFLLFVKQKLTLLIPHGLVERIANVSLGIYVVHPLWFWFLAKFKITPFTIHPLIGIPMTTLFAFTLSALSVSLMALFPPLKKTVS